jgi:hypothetical protein
MFVLDLEPNLNIQTFSLLVNAINQNTITCFKSVSQSGRQRQGDPISRRGVGNITISMECVTLFSSRTKEFESGLGLDGQNSYAFYQHFLHLQRRTPHQLNVLGSRESGLYLNGV